MLQYYKIAKYNPGLIFSERTFGDYFQSKHLLELISGLASFYLRNGLFCALIYFARLFIFR